MILVTIIVCNMCRPLSHLWEPQLHPNARCIDTPAFRRWSNFPQILTDIMILGLPLPVLSKLRLELRDKIGVIVTICLGSM